MERPVEIRIRFIALVIFLGTGILTSTPSAAVERYLDEVFVCSTWNATGTGGNPPTCTESLNVVYGTAFDEFCATPPCQTIELKLDRRAPPASDTVTNRPVIVWAHGGSFKSGDKSDQEVRMREYARRGFVTASINYRLCPNCTPPVDDAVYYNARYDMQMAIRYVRDNAAAWGIDPNRIVAAGHSAGAIMAFGAVYDSANDNDSGTTSSAVAAGILDGPTTSVHYGPPMAHVTEIHWVDSGEPPVNIEFGGAEDAQIRTRYDQIRSKGIAAELSFYPLGVHGLSGYLQDQLERGSQFLYRVLPLNTAITPSTPQAFITQTDLRFATNLNGNPDPPAKTVTITNVGGGTLSWTVSTIPSLVTVTPTSGTGLQRGQSSTISIQPHPTCCAPWPATYDAGDVIIDTAGAAVTTHAVKVWVTATNAPAISLREVSNVFATNTSGLPAPPVQTVTVENVGGGTLNWSATDSISWISEINQTGTSLGPGQYGSFQVSMTPSGDVSCRVPGIEKTCPQYAVSVTASGASTKTTVQTVEYADRARIATSPTELYHFLPANGQNGTTSQFFALTNAWGGTLSWQATHNCGTGVSMIPSSGSLASNGTQQIEMRNTWNPGTTVGVYGGCFVTISDNGSSPAAAWPSETIAAWGVATD